MPSRNRIPSKLTLVDRGVVSYRHLNDWRAMSIVRLMASQPAADMKATIEAISIKMASIMLENSGWQLDTRTPEAVKADDPHILAGIWEFEEVRLSFAAIIADALRQSQLMRCQRASWTVKHPTMRVQKPNIVTDEHGEKIRHMPEPGPWKLQFDPRTMIDQGKDYEDGEALVDLVLAPGLYKRGDKDGERFDVESCVVPSLVTLMGEGA